MTYTDFLADRFAERPDALALASPAGRCTFGEMADLRRRWTRELDQRDVAAGTVVALAGDFSPNAIALFLSLVDRAAIVVPQGRGRGASAERQREIAQVELCVRVDEDDLVEVEPTARRAEHPLYSELRRRGHPGLVGFSSGTSGDPKAAVHDFTLPLEYFHARRPALSTVTFLLFEHLGGIRTMLHALANVVTMAAARDRSPDAVCRLIEEHRLELLPATPSFFNLMLLSGAHRRHDLSSLRAITYGAEPMPQSTLDRLAAAFPGVRLQQTYGLIEVGPIGSRSRGDGSLWMKIGGRGFETRIVDGILQIRSRVMTMGYLNAPTPITSDGWLITGDAVVADGEYMRVLGRDSELINVGGEKVFPAEVESVIQAMEEVSEVTVHGERNPLVGQIVCARVRPAEGADRDALAAAVKARCRASLDRHKVPMRVRVTDEPLVGPRFKKLRGGSGG